jgi:hypothetical protein
MERVNLTENEKLAREVTGLESDAKHFMIGDVNAQQILEEEAANKYNDAVEKRTEELNEHAKKLEEYADYLNQNMNSIEIMPIMTYVLVKPFDENPFQKIVRSEKTGLIIDMGGMKPKYKNRENGEIEEEEQFIHVGTVLEVGSECKYLKEGDIIMWTRTSEVPIPFYKQGLVLVNENRVLVVINEHLKERFYGNNAK